MTARKRSFFNLKEVCSFMGHKHVLLASKNGIDKVDCMTSKVLVTDFCQKKIKKNNKMLTRGIIDPLTGDAVCELAESVKLTLECDERDQYLCKQKKIGCKILKKIFAVNLELTHSSIINNSLRCYYSFSDFDLKNLD